MEKTHKYINVRMSVCPSETSVRPRRLSIQLLTFYVKVYVKFFALSYIFESLPFRLFTYD